MTSDIKTIRTAPSYKDPIRKRPEHPEQDFESLLRKRTESFRTEKAKTDPSDRQRATKDKREDMGEDLSLIERKAAGKDSVMREDGQEEDLGMPAYLLHEASIQQEPAKTDLPTMDAPGAGSGVIPEGPGETGQMIEASLLDPAQRMKDDAVKEIPAVSEDMLQRIEDPKETMKASTRKEEAGQTSTSKPELTPSFLKRLQTISEGNASLKKGGVAEPDLKKEGLEKEGVSHMAEDLKNLENGSAERKNLLDPIKGDLDLNTEGRTKVGSEKEEPKSDAGLEGLKELPQTVRTGESRPVQNVQKAADQGAADRNLELAATKIVHRVETLEDGDRTTIRVRLYPEEIGEMEITLSMEEGKLSGKILVENREMRQVFTERLSELNQTLKACHIDVSKFEVGIGAGQHQDQARQQNQRQAAYTARPMGYGNEPSGMEERKLPGKTTARGIDLLA